MNKPLDENAMMREMNSDLRYSGVQLRFDRPGGWTATLDERDSPNWLFGVGDTSGEAIADLYQEYKKEQP